MRHGIRVRMAGPAWGLPVGVDPSAGQLGIAHQFQAEFGLSFPLVRASGEHVPLTDGAFDLVISEYGAAIWADPYDWIPEASRLLRPGGELVFLGNSTLLMLCVPDEDGKPATADLRRPHFGMHRFEWPDDPTIEFHLGHGDWIRLLRRSSFEILDLIELRPPSGATRVMASSRRGGPTGGRVKKYGEPEGSSSACTLTAHFGRRRPCPEGPSPSRRRRQEPEDLALWNDRSEFPPAWEYQVLPGKSEAGHGLETSDTPPWKTGNQLK